MSGTDGRVVVDGADGAARAEPGALVRSGAPYLSLVDVFGDPEVADCFSQRASVEAWLEVERALATVEAELGIIPVEAVAEILAAATVDRVDFSRLAAEMRVVGYPILPVLEQIAAASPLVGQYLHWGATTQDIMDSGLILQLKRALTRVETLLLELGDELAELALAHRTTVIAGRTHAQQAVPTTFGAKVAVWLSEVERHLARLSGASDRALAVQLFGAAGTAAAYGPESKELRRRLADVLDLRAIDISWHSARDSLAEVAFVLAAAAATCGKIGHEVIELSRSELGELKEGSGVLRGASSTMPQKANPIDSEVVVALSALAAQQLPSLLAAMQGTHERSAGEWQIEWDALPALTAHAAGAIAGAVRLAEGLQVFPERMRANLDYDGGLIMAEAVMMATARLVGRKRSYELVSAACARVRQNGLTFSQALKATLPSDVFDGLTLSELLTPEHYLGEAPMATDLAIAGWSSARGSE